MNKNFTQLQQTWQGFGSAVPHWSVLTNEAYKPHNLDQASLDKFYKSGFHTVENFESLLNKHGASFHNKVILDFGCGVGRLTKSCCALSPDVYGIDISSSHLSIAAKSVTDAEFFLLNRTSLPSLPKRPDIIFSVIVLQHNRPDLIKDYVRQLLKLLKSGGTALLHIPYSILNYSPVTDQVGVMEMHCLPKSDVQDMATRCNCKILEEVPTEHCGSQSISECIYVIRKN